MDNVLYGQRNAILADQLFFKKNKKSFVLIEGL